MSPPRRRSARLKSPAKSNNNDRLDSSKLSSLLEVDESSNQVAQSTLDAIVSSPIAQLKSAMTQQSFDFSSSRVSTPSTANRLYPPLYEMHPSKVQQSTAKQPDSGLLLGFADPTTTKEQPYATSAAGRVPDTPSKIGVVTPQTKSPVFAFSRPDTELGPEAQKIMQDLREEAAAIKAKMVEERAEANQDIAAQGTPVTPGRKFAVPKGKKGRFSDVHMQQFKKMDSIAGHPSAFRTQPGRSDAVKVSLKRTKSQAKLGDGDDGSSRSKAVRLGPAAANGIGREYKSSSPGKQVESKAIGGGVRPASRDGPSLVPYGESTVGSTSSRFRSNIMTPTKASIARAENFKNAKSLMGGLSRSASTKSIKPNLTRSENSHKYLSSLTSFGKMKSLMRRPGDTNKDFTAPNGDGLMASPTPVSTLALKPMSDLNRQLPSIPGTPKSGIPQSKSAKNLNYTPTKIVKAHPSTTPSPTKTTMQPPSSKTAEDPVKYPSLPQLSSSPLPLGTPRPLLTPRPRRARPSGPGDFTFRSASSIKFGTAPNATTIRQVRPSIAPSVAEEFPTIAHGMQNKKRHRDDSSEDEAERSPKKFRDLVPQRPAPEAQRKDSKTSRLQSPLKKGATVISKGQRMLTMSRLNRLASPKKR